MQKLLKKMTGAAGAVAAAANCMPDTMSVFPDGSVCGVSAVSLKIRTLEDAEKVEAKLAALINKDIRSDWQPSSPEELDALADKIKELENNVDEELEASTATGMKRFYLRERLMEGIWDLKRILQISRERLGEPAA